MTDKNSILSYCKQLKLEFTAQNYKNIISNLSNKEISYVDFLNELLKLECDDENKRCVKRRLISAKLGYFKPLAEFDWLWPKKVPREIISELMNLNFIGDKSNIILLGPSGMGKTMIAKNIAYQAAIEGKSSLFIEASDLIIDLEQQESSRLLRQRLNRYIKPSVLVIDEIGYQSYASTQAADLLFQVITKRHEKSSTVITTNLAFKDWGQIFMQASSLVPLIDRLTEKAEIVLLEGESYRRREAVSRKNNKKIERSNLNETDSK